MSTSPKGPPRFVPTLTEVVPAQEQFVPAAPPAAVPPAQAVPESALVAPANSHGPAAQFHETAAAVRSVVFADDPPVAAFAATVSDAEHRVAVVPVLPPGFEELMVHRVMQRVDVVLDERLRDAIATVVQEQTRSILPRLREEIESVVRHAVYEAVADELASGSAVESLQG